MKTYFNQIEINGQTFTNIVMASTYREALKINKARKLKVRGRIFGRLRKLD